MENRIVNETVSYVSRLISLQKYKDQVKEIGSMALLRRGTANIVLAFSGNKGTGKLAMARLVGKMLAELGVIQSSAVVEINKGEVSGSTPEDIYQSIIKILQGIDWGILYLEDAYEIYQRSPLALTNLLDTQGKLIILSGSKEELEKLLSLSELESKVDYRLDFANNTPGELFDMAVRLAEDYQLTMTQEAAEKLYVMLERKKDALGYLGNARYIKKIIDRAYRNAGSRIMEGKDANKLYPEDIEDTDRGYQQLPKIL